MRVTPGRSLRGSYVAAAAALALVAPGAVVSAEAARPTKGADYVGATSQGSRIEVEVGRRGRGLDAAADLRTRCALLGRRTFYSISVLVPVRRGGRFSETSIEADFDLMLNPIVVDGRRKRIFDVSVTRLTGRFVSPRRVRGTLRVESAVYDRATYPADDRPFDKCDTGVVSWTARRR